MKDKKNLLIIILAVVAIIFLVVVVIVTIKGVNHSQNNNETESTTEEITTEETIEDYYNNFENFLEEKDYSTALNYGYMYLDEAKDVQLLETVYVKIADLYVEYKNYGAASDLLKESTVNNLYDKYCQEKLDLTLYEGVYADEESEEHFFFGSYPQNGYGVEEVPEYVANANFDSEGYAKIYGVGYKKIDDIFYVYEPVRWWRIGEESSTYCFFSECILDTKSFNSDFGPATWDVSSLRDWLNGEFYNNCFNEKEKEQLVNYVIPASYNYCLKILSGENSYNDVGVIPAPNLSDGTYIYIDHNSDEMRALRKSKGTDFAISRGLKVDDDNYGRWWTATSADKDNLYTVVVTEAGIILIESGGEVNNKTDVGVRPFIKISKEDIDATNKE